MVAHLNYTDTQRATSFKGVLYHLRLV